MFANFSKKIEITFWDIFIAFLSKATWLKWPLGHLIHISEDKSLKKKLAVAAVIACSGLVFGILLSIVL
jgi:hypothetical protein